MATAPKKRISLARRRRLDDESDDRSVATEVADDSQSDASVPSDVDANADADNSDLSDAGTSASLTEGKTKRKANGSRDAKSRPDVINRRVPSPPIARSDAAFTASRDTEMMINGLKIADNAADGEVVDFETGSSAVAPMQADTSSRRPETFAERKRREHEEYKQKRDADPSFIPNRGAFFMHDHRHGQNGPRQFGLRGGGPRGRGGAVGGPFSPANIRAQASEPTDSPWQHDLHETVAESAPRPQPTHIEGPPPMSGPHQQQASHSSRPPARAPPMPASRQPPSRNFSTTTHTHNAQIRVYLPGMKSPIFFQNVPIKQHTRLPNHRPPLRRDKPVRISLPPSAPRYIFPTVERSFIFIPRALRPNQQGFGRGRGRGFGSFGGGFSSRRTSAYGGSVYSPSVAMSRRSSLAREMGRDGLVSPAGSIMSRTGGFVDPSRPVVRLPPGGPKLPTGPAGFLPEMGSGHFPQQSYPLPQKPAFRENWQGQLPMHQPRPQKTVSVAGIESPASINFNPPQQREQQPFHHQVPAHMNGQPQPVEQQPFYTHARQPSYTASTGTPLSNIPERAIHAPSFQPFQQPGFQPQGFVVPPQAYYFPHNATQPPAPTQFMPPGGMVPMFVPNVQQGAYVMPMAAPPVSTAPAPPAPTGQSNMVAYESNGMTYYVDSSQLYPTPGMEGYPQTSYAVPGMGGMMTPSPEGAYYYPQQMQPAAFYQPQ
ncbi:CASC3/Barentsz eIF4AIII binding-domain-containing protein [Massariosphaeria phaeospora]|uniref:CASC3/Barentsz eIF4AIII binding-domain-containing protein n=1 Tax=Massariosphaeria phaeospora TaxID=100035 RepID=A0A7C8IDH6_9PLEO|nr:CASC3/Barentsz eIF4AIII binding-domain-containing protein [Massariosphaeria phaeospora]